MKRKTTGTVKQNTNAPKKVESKQKKKSARKAPNSIPKPVVLIICDGWGYKKKKEFNAIAMCETTYFDDLLKKWPNTLLEAAGPAVGLPKGQMGNSQVGHITIGSGRIVNQEEVTISKAIKNKSFFRNPVLLSAVNHAKRNNSGLHLMGLVSDGGVHSHIDHLLALLELAKKSKVKKVYIHAILDGRDTAPKSAKKYLKIVQEKIKKIGVGKIATVSGRYYAMDRDNRWDRQRLAYEVITKAQGITASDALDAVDKAYKRGETDEFVNPTVIHCNECQDYHSVQNNDALIFFNFRSDRAREMTRSFTQKGFKKFSRRMVKNLKFVCMTEYDKELKHVKVAFPPFSLKNTLGEVLSKHRLNQLRIAETEKYAHVTYFLNAGREGAFRNEDRILIPSPHVSTYDKKPEMSAPEITLRLLNEIKKGTHDVIIVNYANADMVGHTGDLRATMKAIEILDTFLKEVSDAVINKGGVAFITSDHGNAEEMLDYTTGSPKTSHTTNKVPFLAVGVTGKLRTGGGLSDISPTILKLLGISKPKEMKGKSLIL